MMITYSIAMRKAVRSTAPYYSWDARSIATIDLIKFY